MVIKIISVAYLFFLSSFAFSQKEILLPLPPHKHGILKFLKQNEEWIYAGTSVRNELYYIKTKTLEKYNSDIKFWVKINIPSYKIKNKYYKNITEMALFEVNCSTKKYAILQSVYSNYKGEVIAEFNKDSSELSYSTPDSMAESVIDISCEMFFPTD